MADEPQDKPDQPTSKGKLFIERLNAYRNLILAVAALATAIGSWLKPTDTTATKNSFEWTSKKIEELSANDLKTKEDIVAIRNYLEGYVQAHQSGTAAVALPATEGVGLGSVGTLGHGAGSGTGQGFGSGAGRLSGKPHPRKQPTKSAGTPAAPVTPVAAGDEAPTMEMPTMAVVAFDSAPADPLPELQSNPKAIKTPKFEQLDTHPQ